MEQRKRNIWIEEIQEEILNEIDLSKEVEDDTLAEMIREILELHSSREFIPLKEKASIGKELFNTFRKLDIIQEFLEDEEVTEIMINGTEKIFVEKHGQLYEAERHFYSKKKLEDVIQQIVAGANRIVNEASPIVDARLPDGSRVNVVLSPTALNGPIVTIRKFPKEAVTMQQLVCWGALDEETAEFLKLLVKSKYNIFISGGTGSGKTTFLNALSEFIPEDERVITIEDNAELKIQGIRNLVRLEARNANVEGIGEITIQDLFKSALRMRPDRILVGEVRQFEAFSMIEAMSSGHPGWRMIVESSEQSDRELIRQMRCTLREMQSGIPEEECYERFGMRCKTSAYMKFGAMLSQNLKKGAKGMGILLRTEAAIAFADRKRQAKQQGEEAGTKLLMPMFLMLGVVLLIVVVPAFFSMSV